MKIMCERKIGPKYGLRLGGRSCKGIRLRAERYCEETSLHGFKYLKKTSFGERIFWSLVCIVCTISCALFIYNQMIRYQDNRVTTTVKTTNYPIWEVPFPAVTLCNTNVVYKNHTGTLVKLLENHHISTENINQFFANLTLYILNEKMSHENFNHSDFFHVTRILEAEGFNTERLMKTLAQPCNNMLVKCEWKTAEVDCNKVFHRTKSTGGFCCSFNYKGISASEDNPTDDKNIYVGGVGNSYGLKVYLDAEESQYITSKETTGIWVLVHNPKNFPDVLVYGTHLELNSQMSLAVRPSIISSREEIRKIDVESRGCLFNGEGFISWSKEYTFENCLKHCKEMTIWKYCKCIPFYYLIQTSKYCSILDVICVMRAERAFVNLRTPENQDEGDFQDEIRCNCLSACNEISYSSIIQGEQPISTSSLGSEMINVSVLSVYFENSGIIEYTRSEFTSWDTLLASVGGIFGLFLGGSVMSIIEFFYHIISGISNHGFRVCNMKRNKIRVQKYNPKIYASELYPRSKMYQYKH